MNDQKKQYIAQAEQIIARTVQSLPVELRNAAAEVPVSLADSPDQELIDEGFEPDLLGLFEGEAISERGGTLYPAPPHITLFLDNILEFADHDPDVFLEEIQITYLHELGHYFGWDEDDLTLRDLD